MTRLQIPKKVRSRPAKPPAKTANGRATSTVVFDDQMIRMPAYVQDLASFRRWVHSDDFPEKTGRICFFHGDVWIDMSKEQFFSHNQLKTKFFYVLTGVVKAGRLGRFVSDGMLLTNVDADLCCQPDASFISKESLATGRVRLVEGAKEGFVEMEGTPDMVLEVVSESSVTKDTATLRELYWEAGVGEYWLVDACGERLTFEILRHEPHGYVSVRKHGGGLKSAVLGKSFQLHRRQDEQGNPEYELVVK